MKLQKQSEQGSKPDAHRNFLLNLLKRHRTGVSHSISTWLKASSKSNGQVRIHFSQAKVIYSQEDSVVKLTVKVLQPPRPGPCKTGAFLLWTPGRKIRFAISGCLCRVFIAREKMDESFSGAEENKKWEVSFTRLVFLPIDPYQP